MPLLVVATLFLVLRVWETRGLIGGYDAGIYWTGAKELVRGGNPYDVDTFVVPPSGLVLIAPLALLPFKAAYLLLQLCAAAAIAGAVALLARSRGLSRGEAALGGVLVAGWVSGSVQTIGFGNLNGLILLAWALTIIASAKGSQRGTGVWFGLGLMVKPVLAPVGLVLLAQRRWRASLWSVLPVALATAAGLALAGRLPRSTITSLGHGFGTKFNRADLSLRALGVRHDLDPTGVLALRLLAVGLCLTVAAYVWTAATADAHWDLATMRLVDVGSVLMLGTLLAAPFAWRYYSIFLLPWFLRMVLDRRALLSPLFILGWALLLLPDSLGVSFDAAGAPRFNDDRPTVAVVLLLIAAGLEAVERAHAR